VAEQPDGAVGLPDGEDDPSEMLEQAARLIIGALHEDPTREGLIDTPRRFRDAFMEDFMPNGSPEEALGEMVMEETFDQMIMVRDVPIRSFCEHHILPWFGRVAIGYIPQDKTVGLSKLTRMVAAVGRGLTIQERCTEKLVLAMNSVLRPVGCIVVVEAVHTCTLLRGVRTELQTFTTSAAKGAFLVNPAARQEFLSLLLRGSIV